MNAEKFKEISFDTNNDGTPDGYRPTLLDTYWKEEWSYNDADGCFYYSGTIIPDMTTSTLIRGVEISPSVYKATDGYKLHIDVLTDAVQKNHNNSDEEKPVRWK